MPPSAWLALPRATASPTRQVRQPACLDPTVVHGSDSMTRPLVNIAIATAAHRARRVSPEAQGRRHARSKSAASGMILLRKCTALALWSLFVAIATPASAGEI